MHADHTLGLVPLLTQIMSGLATGPGHYEQLKKQGVQRKVHPPCTTFHSLASILLPRYADPYSLRSTYMVRLD